MAGKTIEIEIRHKLTAFNLNNAMRDRGGMYARSAAKMKMDKDLFYIIKPQVKEKLEGVYEVEAEWQIPSLNRDLDNLLLKSIFDAMQKGGLLIEDNAKHISKITHSFKKVKTKDQGVIVRFKEKE